MWNTGTGNWVRGGCFRETGPAQYFLFDYEFIKTGNIQMLIPLFAQNDFLDLDHSFIEIKLLLIQ